MTGVRNMKVQRVAVVTGASAGIGAATARVLARDGFRVVLGARRLERIETLAAEIGGCAFPLDLRDETSIERFVQSTREVAPSVHLVVNNAAVALGEDRIEAAQTERWRIVWETNVLGVIAMTRGLIPLLRAGGDGRIVLIGSVAGTSTYPGGASYTTTKHALRAITQTLRLELNGERIGICEVSPGITRTEFTQSRFRGDPQRALKSFEGITPLEPADVAECISFIAARPWHVNIDYLTVKPLAQATHYLTNREGKV
jgi:NADP-dependent 3-hydroxy acid dehydrogenase YdfG